jgi:hypothetical protein
MKPFFIRAFFILSILSVGFANPGCSSAPKTSYRQQTSSASDPLAPPAKKETKIDWSDSFLLTAIQSLAFWNKNPGSSSVLPAVSVVPEK